MWSCPAMWSTLLGPFLFIACKYLCKAAGSRTLKRCGFWAVPGADLKNTVPMGGLTGACASSWSSLIPSFAAGKTPLFQLFGVLFWCFFLAFSVLIFHEFCVIFVSFLCVLRHFLCQIFYEICGLFAVVIFSRHFSGIFVSCFICCFWSFDTFFVWFFPWFFGHFLTVFSIYIFWHFFCPFGTIFCSTLFSIFIN